MRLKSLLLVGVCRQHLALLPTATSRFCKCSVQERRKKKQGVNRPNMLPSFSLLSPLVRYSSYGGTRHSQGVVIVVREPKIVVRRTPILSVSDVDNVRTTLHSSL